MSLSLGAAGILAGGSVLSGALGAVGNSLSAYQQSQLQKSLMKYQAQLNTKYSRINTLNQYSWQRQGLERAGYNPQLAWQGAEGVASTGWANSGQASDSRLGSSFGEGINNALSFAQQLNNDKMTDAQVMNYNADSVLKNNQAITEMYSQLEKLNHADLMSAEKVLTDKDVSWYDRKQAREDKRLANEIEKTGNELKVGMMNALTNQLMAKTGQFNAETNRLNAHTNATSVQNLNALRNKQMSGIDWDNFIKELKARDLNNPVTRSIYSYPGFHSPY